MSSFEKSSSVSPEVAQWGKGDQGTIGHSTEVGFNTIQASKESTPLKSYDLDPEKKLRFSATDENVADLAVGLYHDNKEAVNLIEQAVKTGDFSLVNDRLKPAFAKHLETNPKMNIYTPEQANKAVDAISAAFQAKSFDTKAQQFPGYQQGRPS